MSVFFKGEPFSNFGFEGKRDLNGEGAEESFHGTLRDRMRDQLSFKKVLCKQLLL